jgi:maleylpyruvate isomerase
VNLDTRTAVDACRASHRRLLATVENLDEATARRPSRLPDWTVGHVLTHIARNADGHTRRLEAALRGEDLPRYPGGVAQRNGEIAEGAGRPAGELSEDVRTSTARLEEVWQRCADAGWDVSIDLLGDDTWPVTESAVRRLREVEVHHVDLGLGYTPGQWPHIYVQWELQHALARLPGRFADPADARAFLAFLLGRAAWPAPIELRSWES